MKDKRFITKLIALILSVAMTLPAAVFALEETGTEEIPDAVTGTEAPVVEDSQTENEAPPEPAAEPEEEVPEEPVVEPGFLEKLTIVENPMGTVELKWAEYAGSDHYEVSSPGINGGAAARTKAAKKTFTGLKPGHNYDFAVTAFDSNGGVTARGAVSIKTTAYRINFTESRYRILRSKTVKPKRKLKGNLTSMIKEGNGGYAVVQGGCTDGTYAYYLMVSSKTQKGRVLKVKLSNNKVIARSKVLKTWHGNGMTYDSKRKKLVVCARDKRKQELTVIDAKTLKVTRQGNVKYNHYKGAGGDSINKTHQSQGLAAVAYVAKYDCYIALERVHHNLLIFNPDNFEAIGMVRTNLGSKYPGTFQAMDADDKYVYLLLSKYNKNGKKQPYNIIVTLDWNSEKLLPVVNACKSKALKYVKKAWACNNNGSGKPDAVIRITTKYEAENIYHTTDKSGKEHFYLAEYYGHGVYKTVTKRVKVRGKWKRKKVKKLRYYKRDNFVYDLGVI